MRNSNFTIIFFTLFFCGLFSPQTAVASSTVDSLYQSLETAKEDTFQVHTLLKICWQLHRTDIKETKRVARRSLALSEKLAYQNGIGESYSYISWAYFSEGESEKALEYSQKTALIGEQTNDIYLCNIAYNDIAMIYSETGRPDEALEIWQKSIDLNIESGKTESIPVTYYNMADLLTETGNVKEARKYFLKALEASKLSNNSMIISTVHLGVADMYSEENNIEEAEKNYKEALKIAEKDDDLEISAFAILGLCKINAERGNKEIALQQADDAIRMAEQIGDTHSEITAYAKLAEIQKITEEYEKSLNSSHKLIQLTEKVEANKERIIAYKEISKTYSIIHDYEQAYFFSEKYHILKDSLFSEERTENVLNLEKKYASDLKEKENTVLRLQKKEQELKIQQNNTFNNALLFILFLLGILGFMAYRRYLDKISAHKILEEKVNERTEELRLMNKNLEISNKELERFAYIASHDLREPLRNISGFAKLLKRELKPQIGSNVEEYLSFITNNTSQLSTLIQDILAYSKLNQEKEKTIAVDPNLIINNINNSLAHSIKEKKVKIFIKGTLPMLQSSGQQIHFLFKNLIENGIKYNNSSFPRIDIICNDVGDKYEFFVRDNGIGIDPEYSAKVFEMFTRLHDRKQFTGTGLGLSLCKKIVENHGGKISVESTKGKGSTFIFTLAKYQLEKNATKSKNVSLLEAI